MQICGGHSGTPGPKHSFIHPIIDPSARACNAAARVLAPRRGHSPQPLSSSLPELASARGHAAWPRRTTPRGVL
eukprot:4784342-Prymnesium_polylepis.1